MTRLGRGYAFYYYSKLSNVEISENSCLTRIGECVFKADTKLTSRYIPDCMFKLDAGIFQDAIANVTLYVAESSYAQTYAEKYGIAYVTEPLGQQYLSLRLLRRERRMGSDF